MAPVTTVAELPPSTDATPRNYWQLPTFVLGLTALVAAVIAFPPAPQDPAVTFRAEVFALRAAIEQRGISPLTPQQITAIATATQQVASEAPRFPAYLTDAHFAVGTGYVFLADYGPATEMGKHWQAAAAAFQQVDLSLLADPADEKRFQFRNAKVLAALEMGNPGELYQKLTNPPVGEDDGGERARLLADVALRMTPPEYKRAQIELSSYLGGPPHLPPAEIAKLKVRLANVYIHLKEPEKARPWLEDMARATTPPTAVAEARYHLAKLAEAENNWPEAASLLESTASLAHLPIAQRAEIDYEAGLVRLRLGDSTAAIRNFQQVANKPVPAAPAAGVRLAELLVQKPESPSPVAEAVSLLERSVHDLHGSPPIALPLLTPPETQSAFEIVIRKCQEAADFIVVTRAVQAYEKVAEPRRYRELRAETLTNWGDAFGKQGDNVAAQAKHREAAAEFAALAESDPNPTGKAEFLRRTAECYRKIGDTAAALKTIEQIPTINGLPPATAAQAWLNKGELLLASHQYIAAENALQKAMAAPGPTAVAARVKLALAQIEQGRSKLAAATSDDHRKSANGQIALGVEFLGQVANMASADETVARDAKLQALFELGKILLQQGSIPDAETRFRQLLQLGPAGAQAPMAKLYLGSCLLLLARGDHQGGRPPADADRKLAEARTLFEELADTPDSFLQAQADVRLANTTLLLKKYDDMPALCERLAKKYQGKVEELIVLSMLYSAYRFADRQADATRTLDRMYTAFSKLTPSAFPGGADEYTQAYWQKQWFDVLRPSTTP
ncbi:MAG: tetratricopeptide repeat protein [Bacteroidales bacterium]|nr:tetratricopeptide repeat protein [Bacteroidales bacterium]